MKLFRTDPEVATTAPGETGVPVRSGLPPVPPANLPSRPEVYPGNMPVGRPIDLPTTLVPGPRNRKILRRRTSPFSVVVVLLGVAVAIVLYISNIIAVGQLLNEINALQTQYDQITMEQEILKAQINKMASLERIQEKAQGLDLKNPSESPIWLQIDQEKLKQLEEARKEP